MVGLSRRLRLLAPDAARHWWLLAGRPPLGIIASGVADLNLHVAMRLKELQLPAALAKVVLAARCRTSSTRCKPTTKATG